MRSATRIADRRGARVEHVGELLRPTIRAMRWTPPLTAACLAFVQVFVQTRDVCPPSAPCVGPEVRVLALRIAAILLALGTSFILDDPTEDTTAHLPTPLWLRRAVRVGLAAPLLAVTWALLVPLAMRSSVDPRPFPTGALTLELAALTIWALAVSASSARFVPEGMGGVAAGPILLGLVAAANYLPRRMALFVLDPQDPRWQGAHDLWRLVLFAAIATLLVASRDPGRASLRRHPHASVAGRPARTGAR
ncbi:MAG: hypothetical protein E6G44_02335 [Actinobacteria bacterium]|nr:MAG: hypothetical protein E6G44_02335 [Actinomycetota bacterium]